MNTINIKVRFIDGPSFAQRIIDRSARDSMLRAGAAMLKRDTVENFGTSGKDRPSAWASLSRRYGKRVGRTSATLDLTGTLFRSLRIGQPNGNSIDFYTDDPKAEFHQFGMGHNPLRPFIPITKGGELTSRARNRVETAIRQEAERLLRKL